MLGNTATEYLSKLPLLGAQRPPEARARCGKHDGWFRFLRPRTAMAICVLFATTVHAQDSLGEQIEGVQAELATTRPLYDPAMPIIIRYTLRNLTDQPMEIQVDHAYPDSIGIGLPIELAFGTEDNPLLTLKHDDNAPDPLAPPAGSPTGTSMHGHTLRLAPRGAVGGELDLRDATKSIRYPGLYRLEWRALGGRVPTATVEFRVEPRKQAAIVTDYGVITFNLLYDAAPRNVENFLELVRQGFYKNLSFHRIIPGFIAQGGCPKGDGTGTRPDGRLIAAELHSAPVDVGTIAMAHRKDAPDTASCQFFIALARLPDLDGKYTVIGQATDAESLRTLQAIASVPTDRNGKPIHGVLIRSINLLDLLPESRKTTGGK